MVLYQPGERAVVAEPVGHVPRGHGDRGLVHQPGQGLRQPVAPGQEPHFGRAADRLGMAQPPLSRIIKHLERQLGTALFHRTTRQVELTPAGQALSGPAERLARSARDAHRAVRSALAGEPGHVQLGFAGVSVNRTAGALARQVRQARPELELGIHSSQFSQPSLERILDRSLDLAIGRWDFLPEGSPPPCPTG